MAEKKKIFAELIEPYKNIISIFIPLITLIITANTQFSDYMRKSSDENFRSIVKLLSSENKEERLAAASNMGTFIKEGSRWPYVFNKSGNENTDNAIDILINRVSVELDYNVLNAIKGSLMKIKKKEHDEYKKIIQKLLDVDRNIFIQNYALKKWKDDSQKEYFQKENEYATRLKAKEVDKTILDNIKEEMKRKQDAYLKREKDFSELSMHKQVNADFIAAFLDVTKYYPIEGLNFYLNSLNSARLFGLNFKKSNFERSAISNSIIEEATFDGATIIDTLFTFSDLTKSRFVDCKITASLFNHISSFKGASFSAVEFNDVFFVGSDLTEANFKGAKGLKPIYFYKAKNIEKAEFDNEFKIKLTNELGIDSVKMTDEKFLEYIKSSELRFRKDKIAELETTLKELKTPEQEKDKKKSKTF